MEPSATSQVLGFVLVLFVIVVMACAVLFLAALCRAAGRTRPRPPIAAPAPALDPQVPVRATTTEPALRVHLCTRCLTHPVARPGETCYPYCESVVHAAERILRADGGAR